MRLAVFVCSIVPVLALVPSTAGAQAWNDSATVALVARAAARRTVAQGDSGLRSWQVRAHGVVLFLAQLGEGGTGPTRPVKGDELDVEVYWSAPGRSKQVIRGWRDRRYLPTDIRYHRDHLGIVTDGYGPRIRIGEGDEVRDVIHPLGPEGPAHYDFLHRDSAQVGSGGRTVVLDVVEVRPRDAAAPGVVGTLYLDRATAELVRARWTFTPASYIDRTVEQLTVLLDYALIEGRAWLPWRQAIEIRRNAGWLDLPYRGIIRATWDFGDYTLDVPVPPAVLAGVAIGGLRQPGDSARPWPVPFDRVMAEAGPEASERELAEARAEVARAVEARMVPRATGGRPSVGRVSDVVRFDRVQGVALGAGVQLGVAAGAGWRVSLRPDLGLGLADHRMTGGAVLSFSTLRPSPVTVALYADRRIRDLSDLPVISPTLNSLTAQESGDDHGDYALVEGAGVRVEFPLIHNARLLTRLGWEDPGPLGISATPARGAFRPQVDLGAPGYWTGAVTLGAGDTGADGWRATATAGAGRDAWARVTGAFQVTAPVGGTDLRWRGYGGMLSDAGPAWRGFVLGGRGTLPGEPFRRWGGRRMAWGSAEWRIPVPVPAVGLGDFASTGRRGVLAPFVAAGWADGPIAGMGWGRSGTMKGSAGLALELFYQLIRIEAGASLQTGKVGVTFDVGRAWWGVL